MLTNRGHSLSLDGAPRPRSRLRGPQGPLLSFGAFGPPFSLRGPVSVASCRQAHAIQPFPPCARRPRRARAARLAMRQEQHGVRRQRRATHPYVLYVRTELQAKRRSPCCVSSHPHAKRQMTRSVRRLPHVKQLPPFCVGLRPRAMRQLPSGVRAPRRVTQRLPLCVRPKRRAMHCFACRVKAVCRATRQTLHCVMPARHVKRQSLHRVRAMRHAFHRSPFCVRPAFALSIRHLVA